MVRRRDRGTCKITRWDTVKSKMTKRFGISTATPLIDAQRRRLKREEKVEQYFRDKMRLLRQTRLSDEEMAQQLTEGLPFQWKLSLAAARPSDPNAWVEVAQQIETHFSAQSYRQAISRNNTASRNKTSAKTLNASTSKPYTPCNICKRLGRTEYHWHRDCPNRQRTDQQRTRPNHTVQPATLEAEPTEEEHTLN